jgi:16S rRNA (guanine527-N7)-methyltransferase
MSGTGDTRKRLLRRLRRVHVEIADEAVDQLVAYYELLLRWNTKMNLTGLPDGDEAVDRLLVEPVVAARFLDAGRWLTVDVGSGGGSPALPLKIAAPGLRLRMVESKVRKSAFLREAVRHLALDDVAVETGRLAIIAARAEYARQADVVTMRAVRPEPDVMWSVERLLRTGGRFLVFGRVGMAVQLEASPGLRIIREDVLVPSLQSAIVALVRTAE